MSKVFFVAWAILIVVLIIGGLLYYSSQVSQCDAAHGALVKGAFGYACVARAGN